MKLIEYLKLINQKQYKFAEIANVNQATISRAINGKRLDPDTALRIEKATNRAVSKEELMYPAGSVPPPPIDS